MPAPLKIEFFYEPDCDSRDVSLARLREVAAEAGDAAMIDVIRVDTHEDAVELRFTGSPTIRIDGQDIDPPDANARYLLTCRAYRLADGRITPFPPKELIRTALRNAMSARTDAGRTSEGGSSMTTETEVMRGTQAWAGQNPLPLGAAMPPFELLEPATGAVRRSRDLATKEVAAVYFISSHCPHSAAWEDRLLDLARAFADRVTTVFVCSSDPARFPEDGPEEMTKRVTAKNFPAPYLLDPDQKIADEFSAFRTPHCFVFRSGRLVYNGTVDDNAEEPAAVTKTYLRDALEEAAGGRPVSTPTSPVQGCGIKRKTDKAAGGR
jgi:AhpC/TSA family protein